MYGVKSLVFLWIFVLSAAPACIAGAAENESEAMHGESHGFHPNLVGVFLGVTDEGREEAPTIGIEYERRINASFGIGAVAEYASQDLDFFVFAVPFAFHNGPWKLYVAPGIEDSDHGSEYLTRIGAEYAFEVGAFEIAPQLNVDFVDGEEIWVAGLVFAKGF